MNTQQNTAYSNHDEIWMLLPWYANGSLEGFERERVKAHAGVCLICRKELAAQALLAKQLEHTPRVEISSKPSFERLMSRIREEEKVERMEANRVSQAKTNQKFNWKQWFDAYFTPQRLTAAFATGLLVIAIPFLLNAIQTTGGMTYHTVANPKSLDRFSHNDITVIFADKVAKEEIISLVGSVHASIVDGPSPSGAYTVRISGDSNDGGAISQTLSQLRRSKAVIFAEPALPQPSEPNKGGG